MGRSYLNKLQKVHDDERIKPTENNLQVETKTLCA